MSSNRTYTIKRSKKKSIYIKTWGVCTLVVTPGLEAPGGLGGLCGSRSNLGGTGGRED